MQGDAPPGLMAVSLLVSLRLSRLAFRSKALARQATLAQEEIDELRQEVAKLRKEVTAASSDAGR